MFVIFAVFLLFLGTSSYGVPLESPTADLAQYFDSRIVGGINAPPGKAPWMAGMRIGAVFYVFICGGSILNERHVLTAAHCIEAYVYDGAIRSQVHIVVDTTVWWRDGTVSPVVDYRIHPQYNRVTFKYDVGILILGIPLDFSKGLSRPVALDWNKQPERVKCFVTGWGAIRPWGPLPDEKQYLEVSTIPISECESRIIAIGLEHGIHVPPVDKKCELCTLHSFGHGVCSGDSGSALMSVKTGKQIGIVSWGFVPCASGVPDVFVAIHPMKRWIHCMLNEKTVLGGQEQRCVYTQQDLMFQDDIE